MEGDERAMELSSIAAIFPELKIDEQHPFKASLELPITLPSPLRVRFSQGSDNNNATNRDAFEQAAGAVAEPEAEVYELTHLPPLDISIELPDGYPTENPPIFNITTSPPWLPGHTKSNLLSDGRRLWEEAGKDMVVYTYIDHLQQLAEQAFGLVVGSAGNEVIFPRNLKISMLDFDLKAKKLKFEQETFECGVCLEPKKGVNCHRMLQCSHVFCRPCLQDFYNTCITEGDVDNVKCMAPDCGKQTADNDDARPDRPRKKRDRTISPTELLQIPLEREMVQRYVFLKRKKKLESNKNTIYCPRKWCQGVAHSKRRSKPDQLLITDNLDEDSDEDDIMAFDPMGPESQLPPVAKRVVICEDCEYAFCCVCKKGWHGELVRCSPRREAELSAEEKATEEYMRLYTTKCPTCATPCQKRMGCNHMICFQCSTHFCYLCSSWLEEDNPYRHFNTIDSSCFNRLWDLEGGDGIDPEGAEELHRFPAFIEDLEIESESDSDNDRGQPDWISDSETSSDNDENEHAGFQQGRHPPPPAPAPPRNHARGNGDGVPPHRNHRNQDHRLHAAAAEQQAQALAIAQLRNQRAAAAAGPRQVLRRPVGGGLVPAHQRNRQPFPGLQRFLELAENDQEDEWDSDELE